ncbi:hypothetical protein [Mammaliicoccus phage vB_MscM-PMS3]|nr:hypothetical protein [Mammaliicoccus phage vB_MscM-PMS3]WBF82104.1 hypothetical protein [Mammaliicoccus virus vB_MscM-PMS2]
MAFYVVKDIKEITSKELDTDSYYEVELEKFGDINKKVYLKLTDKQINDNNIKPNTSIML